MVAADDHIAHAQQLAATSGDHRTLCCGCIDHLNTAVGGRQLTQLGDVGAQVGDGAGRADAQRGFAGGQHLSAGPQAGDRPGEAAEADAAVGLQPSHDDVARRGEAQVAAGGAQIAQGHALAAGCGSSAVDLQVKIALAQHPGSQGARAQAGEWAGAVGHQGEAGGYHR